MIEVKFSLELTKNGVQKCVHAKSGEENSRKAVITLTENGKVFDAAGYYVKVYFDDGKHVDTEDDRKLVTVENGCIGFVIPYDLVAEEGERLCEIQISKDKRILYSPVFKVLVEQSLGQHGVSEPVGDVTRYQEVIPDLMPKDDIFPDDEIAVYTPENELTTRRKISDLPFGGDSVGVALQSLVAMLATEKIYASVESPDVASKSDSIFSGLIGNVNYDFSLYYSPSASGTLTYTDHYVGETLSLNVSRGDVYEFHINHNTYSDIEVRKMESVEDVKTLEELAYRNYVTDNEIPKKLSAFENDTKFVSKNTVEQLIGISADDLRAEAEGKFVDETEATILINQTLNKGGFINRNQAQDMIDEAVKDIGGSSTGGSADVPTMSAQMVTYLLENFPIYVDDVNYEVAAFASTESVERANEGGSRFQTGISNSQLPPSSLGSVCLYSPPDSGTLTYGDKELEVNPGVIYIFYTDEETWELTYTTRETTGIRQLLFDGIKFSGGKLI